MYAEYNKLALYAVCCYAEYSGILPNCTPPCTQKGFYWVLIVIMLNVVAPTKSFMKWVIFDEMSEFSWDIDIYAQQERLECGGGKVFKGKAFSSIGCAMRTRTVE